MEKMKVMENDLRGKRVMSDEGMYLGTLRNITVNEKTGKLENLLVEPSDKIDPRLYQQDEEGYLLFPFDSVKSVRDVIVVGEE
ncbi:MAG: PRC-barrel domain protein [Thermoplasmata archaeon]|nr:MAG: PRC-barrel domain protein [Thermoplasmata archaeon]